MVADALRRMLDELEGISARLAEIKDCHVVGDDPGRVSRAAMALTAKATAVARDAALLSARLDEEKRRQRVN